MLEQCDFMELTEEVLQQCKGFICKDEDITEFFAHDYADYAYQLLGKSYCFVKPETSEIICAFTVANSSVKVDSLPSNLRNKLNRKIPNAKRRPQYPAVLVGQLAVSDLFCGHHVGDELLDFIKSWFIDPLNKTGCRYVIVMLSTIRKYLNIINEMVSNFCFRQMRRNGPSCITKVKSQQLR